MEPQNTLFLLSDQHSRKALGCYGHPLVRTPNLDKLAARGTLFRNAYCNAPICVPARATLATGRYVHDIGYWDNGRPYEGATPSWAHRLVRHGHGAESIGKLHYRSAQDPTGFDRQHIPMHVVGGSGDQLGSLRDGTALLKKYRGYHDDAGPGDSTYTTYDREITATAVEWLQAKGAERGGKPWVTMVSLVCPHPPLKCPQPFYDMYPPQDMPWPVLHDPGERPEHPAMVDHRRFQGTDQPFSEEIVRRSVSAYFGLCSYLDDNIGKILAALEASGMADNTRIIYASDHGESNGNQGLWGKCNMYEDSVGVPLIIAGAGVPEGKVVDTPVSHVDLYPTLLQGAGIEPTDDDRIFPGTSLFDLANGADPDRIAFAEHHASSTTTAVYMVRKGAYKLIYYVGYASQLFDLESDPDERHDLAGLTEHRQTCEDMEALLRQIVDPEAVNARAKADQSARIATAGGRDAVRSRGGFGYTPVPGEEAVYQ